jgi:6-phosphogluconolactonase (cycloisomerase 2 family)
VNRRFLPAFLLSTLAATSAACDGGGSPACEGICNLTVDPGACALYVSWSSSGGYSGFDVSAAVAPALPVPTGYGLAPSATSFTLTGLTPGITYNVLVTGWSGQGIVDRATAQGAPGAGSDVAYVAAAASAGGAGNVLQYSIHCADGTLAPMALPSVTAGNAPVAMIVEHQPIGVYSYVYTLTSSDDDIWSYGINMDGSLDYFPGEPKLSTGMSPIAGAFTTAGSNTNLYVANNVSNDVSQYAVDGLGNLTAITPPVGAGTAPSGLCAIGRNVYVANAGASDGISQYVIQIGGVLQPLSPPMAGSTGQLGIACRPSGPNVYATGSAAGHGYVLQYAPDGNGLLVPLASPQVPTSSSTPSAIVLDPDATHLFVLDAIDEVVSLFTVGAGGDLTPMSPPTVPLTGSPTGGAFDPTGKYFYVTLGSGGIAQFAVGATTITPASPAIVSVGSSLSAQAITTVGVIQFR